MISAVIVSFNEAEKLAACLESIQGFVDEIIVINLESTDNTVSIARSYHAKTVDHKKVPYVELIRNFSIEQTSGEWVLILDPDEQLSQSLIHILQKVVTSDEYDVVDIPRKNIFFGKWIAHSNFWPDYQMRFFKKGAIVWDTTIHSYPKVSGKVCKLEAKQTNAILHYGYDTYRQFFQKQHRYSTVEAHNKLISGQTFSVIQLIWMPLREFLVRFIKHRGYLDGFQGVFLVVSLMYYQVLVQLKMLRNHK
jgi:(heptosyl)LPS beta-1,4-glucosyltransferase